MKLTKTTVNTILKNFAGINSNLLIKKGSKLSTISAQKNIVAEVTVEDKFPVDFGIYDLNEFLGILSLFEDPEVEFTEKFVTIKQGDTAVKYTAAEQNVLAFPSKSITFPDPDVEFTLSASDLDMIIKTSSVLRVADLAITGDGEEITLVVGDKKNATGNTFTSNVGATDKVFKIFLKVENLKMVPGEYSVQISSKKISKFEATDSDLVYFVAVESDSTFG